MEKTIIILISAHFVADFALQPDVLVKNKSKIWVLFVHGLVHAFVTYVLFQAWGCCILPLCILLLHIFIDKIKLLIGQDTSKSFVWDQIIHILSLIGIAWVLVDYGVMFSFSGIWFKPIVVFAGFVATVRGAGFFVGKVAERMKLENDLKIDGLKNGGTKIGNIERALIFLFIFINQPAGIGFLVAAKSILRFEEAKNQKLAEYVLIGTLLSFSLAIALASATKWAVCR